MTEPDAPSDSPANHTQRRLSRRLALGLLGVAHIAAFTSFAVQAPGLIGEDGIQPAADWLARVGPLLDARDQSRFFTVPTLGWLTGASDLALAAMSWTGATLGLLLVLGLAPRLVLALQGLLYLSLFSLGGPFLSFQWDILLIEATALAIVYAPPGLRPRPDTPEPTAAGVWLMRLLLFKLLFMSGVVKLTSGDPTWQDLTALDHHFRTQPLPHFAAWYAAQSPDWARAAGVLANHFAELFAPWLILFDPRGRRLAAWLAIAALLLWWGAGDLGALHVTLAALAAALLGGRPRDGARIPAAIITLALMASIAATGNYGFFQLLTLALAATLLDDAAIRRALPQRLRARLPRGPGPTPPRWDRRLTFAAAALLIPASALLMTTRLAAGPIRRATTADPGPATAALRALDATATTLLRPLRPFVIVNGYGLFATMTTTRDELIIEGTDDGHTWRPYPLPYKPDAPDDPLRLAGLHMPRLDWQLWFAALRPRCTEDHWTIDLVHRLLEGSPPVRALFDHPPFADAPPRAIRIRRADARFTTPAQRAATGAEWTFTPAGEWCPPLTLDAFRQQPK
ncbi:MAG: lipase maturation factor family protein [Myxococcales bacterium]|nr:lipase maturation factor family protein [Myxococcales bacterium]